MPFSKTFVIAGTFMLTACSSQPSSKYEAIEMKFPDTAKTWAGRETIKAFYFTRSIEKELDLPSLSNGTNRTEVRIWRLFDKNQTLKILYRSTLHNWKVRTIEIYRAGPEALITDHIGTARQGFVDSLLLDKYWTISSQSDLSEGDKYGCLDGDDVLIEMANSKAYKILWYRCPDINQSKDSVFLLANRLIKSLLEIGEFQ